MFVFALSSSPALAGPEQEPVAHVGHLCGSTGGPASVDHHGPRETIDDLRNLFVKLGFGILRILGAGQRTLLAQIGDEIAEFPASGVVAPSSRM